MIQHYKDEGVSHNAADIIRYIRFKNKDMKELFDRDGTITFWTAANLATNKSFIIIEYNEDPHSPDPAPVFYSMEALGVTICPPPDTPPCDTETLSL